MVVDLSPPSFEVGGFVSDDMVCVCVLATGALGWRATALRMSLNRRSVGQPAPRLSGSRAQVTDETVIPLSRGALRDVSIGRARCRVKRWRSACMLADGECYSLGYTIDIDLC